TVAGKGLLPSTCLFGNSFSDGMMRVGLGEHFEKLTRFNRHMPVLETPKMASGRCKYLIVQMLDISPAWSAFSP
ncbi:MAG: hypothetical protein ACREP7_05415, partial [Lysobacter sp.]